MFGKEPAVILGALQATLALGLSFGLHLNPGQIGAIMAAAAASSRLGGKAASHTGQESNRRSRGCTSAVASGKTTSSRSGAGCGEAKANPALLRMGTSLLS